MKKITHMLIVGMLLVSCAAAIGIGRESDVLTTSVHVTFTKPIMKQTTPDMFEALRPYMIQQYYKLFGENVEFLGDVAGGAVRNYLHAFPGMDAQLDAKIIEQVIFFGDPSLKIGGYN